MPAASRTWSTLCALAVLAATPAALFGDRDPSSLLQLFARQAPKMNPGVLQLALRAADCAEARALSNSPFLTVIDYSLPSTQPRLWVFDLERRELLFRELVAHGVNTGENFATRFSNRLGSRQSSLGLFLTDRTYFGRNGYSLRLRGLETGINHKAMERTIVMHGAWYVSEDFAEDHGRLGRSWGCPALEKDVAADVIDTIKDGSLLFVYYPDSTWLRSSRYLNDCTAGTSTASSALTTMTSPR